MFTIKYVWIKDGGNLSQSVYACSHYEYESRGTRETGDPKCATDQYGPKVTLFDDKHVSTMTLCFGAGTHIYVENDRGKTVDHFYGAEWLAWSCYDVANKVWRDPNNPPVI